MQRQKYFWNFLVDKRDRANLAGRKGFVKMAIRAGVPRLAVSLPWGVAPAALPQFPLPAKIRTRLMPAVELNHDPALADDDEYLEAKFCEVQDSIQCGMDALARKRALPLFG